MKAIMRDKAEMKHSGIEWIGLYPVSWDMYPANGVFSEIRNKNTSLEYTNQFSFRYGEIVDKNVQGELDDKLKDTISAYNIVQPDTIMINGLNLNYDFISQRVAIVREPGIITSAYLALCPNKERINPRFAVYLFKAYDYQQVFHGMGSGIRKTLSFQNFKNIFIVAPQLDMQEHIAHYLDDRCSKIDTIIAEAKASIEEYKELKQAVIYEAVTKGINHTQCKHIDIDYLDDMPVNWHISSIGLLFQFIGGYAYKSDRFIVDSNFQVIRIGNVKDNNLVLERNPVFISAEYAIESNNAQIQVGDILFTMTGTKGKGDYFYTLIIKENDLVNKKLFVNQRVGCFRKSNSNIYMAYYNYLLKMPKIREYVFLFETGTANQGNIGIEVLNRIKLYCPPYDEQVKIVDYLDNKTERIDNLISEKQSLIEDLEAYKKSLIYEVVTGKRKVVE